MGNHKGKAPMISGLFLCDMEPCNTGFFQITLSRGSDWLGISYDRTSSRPIIRPPPALRPVVGEPAGAAHPEAAKTGAEALVPAAFHPKASAAGTDVFGAGLIPIDGFHGFVFG